MSGKPRPTAVKKPAEGPRNSRSSQAVRRALRGESVSHEPLLVFTRTNYLLMGAGVLFAIVGFVLLRGGDVNLAPILLVAGYCALIPLGIIWRDKLPGESRGPKPGE